LKETNLSKETPRRRINTTLPLHRGSPKSRPFLSPAPAELNREPGDADVYVIDEIGRMECMSEIFVKAIVRILDAPVPVLATIAAKGGGFITEVKARPDVEIVTVTAANRDALPDELAGRLRSR
jgi:nucleoside-triphosphatase THEP1